MSLFLLLFLVHVTRQNCVALFFNHFLVLSRLRISPKRLLLWHVQSLVSLRQPSDWIYAFSSNLRLVLNHGLPELTARSRLHQISSRCLLSGLKPIVDARRMLSGPATLRSVWLIEVLIEDDIVITLRDVRFKSEVFGHEANQFT